MSIKILLVEDNPADADLLQELLEASTGVDWELVSVESRKEAFQELSRQGFDVVLLDLSLPDSHGLETLIRLRQVAQDTAMVVMTGLDDEAIALEAVRLGAQDYLVKGQITPQLLVRALRYAIERSQTLHLLGESERRFRAIFDQTFQLMGLLTPEGIVLEINQTALDFAGMKLEEVVGHPFWESPGWRVDPSSQEKLQQAIAAAALGEFVRYEADLLGKDNTVLTIDFSIKPVADTTGKVVMLIAEGRDISDRKQAEAEILKALVRERELSELRAKFVTMVSHEFRTPLSTIVLSSGLVESYGHKWSDEKKLVHFQRIKLAVKRMTELLEDVLVIGKAEAGKLEFQPVPMNLERFCHSLVEELQLTDAQQHPIVLNYQAGCRETEMDEKLLRHILSNLLSNAIKYSPQGSQVKLEIAVEEEVPQDSVPSPFFSPSQWVIFRIQDQGIGIPLEDQPRIFETFQRASNVGNISGTGLGLAIVKRSVELHGGQISVASEVGAGTTFTVVLPLRLPAKTESVLLNL
ncbi:MAG: ATP-binding protein [Actinomycetota bacterium]